MTDWLRYRKATETDLPYVVGGWVSSYRMSHHAGPIPMDEYWPTMTRWVEDIIKRDGCTVLVAYKPDELPPHDVYGWICTETGVRIPRGKPPRVWFEVPAQPVLHYIFVKNVMQKRKTGYSISRELLREVGVEVTRPFVHTFCNATSAELRRLGKIPGAQHRPLVVRFPKNETYEVADEDGQQRTDERVTAGRAERHA